MTDSLYTCGKCTSRRACYIITVLLILTVQYIYIYIYVYILIFSLCTFKSNCKYLAFTCHGWYSTCCISSLSGMTKVTLTAFTNQCIITGQILAAVRLAYRSACLMMMLRLGVGLFVVVSVFYSSLGPTY